MNTKLRVRLIGNSWCFVDQFDEELASFDRSEWGDKAQDAAISWREAYNQGFHEATPSAE